MGESGAWDASSENAGDDSEDEGDGDGDDADVPNPAMIFIRILLNLVFVGTLSARHLCILCFWAVKMGCEDPIDQACFLQAEREHW